MSVSDLAAVAVLQCAEYPTAQEQQLARRLQIGLLAPDQAAAQQGCQYLLQYLPQGLSIYSTARNAAGPSQVDFTSKSIQRRLQEPLVTQTLGKAMGLRKQRNLHVLDATAGFGTDGFLLAAAGCDVTMLERSAIVFALLSDGLLRVRDIPGRFAAAAGRISLHQQDFLSASSGTQQYDVVYLDPMFPGPARSARAKKNMHFLQQLLEKESSEQAMLTQAMKLASNRVVVKRGRHTPVMNGQEPQIQFKGSSSRFDVYLIR